MKDQGLRYQLYKAGLLDNDYANKNAFRQHGWEGLQAKVALLEKRYEELTKMVASLAQEIGYELAPPQVDPKWVKVDDKYTIRSRGPQCNIKK